MIAHSWSSSVSVFIMVLLLATKAAAVDVMQVFVHTAYEKNGQGFLVSWGINCLLIVPGHVVAETSYAILYGPLPDRLEADADTVQELLGDVTVMRVENGPLARRCGPSLLGFGPFDERLAANRDATLVSVLEDGSWSRRPVVIRQVGFVFLTIEPREEPLQEGLSGSLIVLGNDVVGMLQTVRADGTATALRLERIAALLRDYFENNKPSALQTVTDGERPPSSTAQGATVASWKNADVIGPEYRISNLLDGDDQTAWIANVEKLPVEVNLQFPGDEPVTLTRIRLVSDRSGRANGSPPGEVEILRAIAPGRLSSLAHGVFQADASSLELECAPAKASLVRLKIYSIKHNSDRLMLSEIQFN